MPYNYKQDGLNAVRETRRRRLVHEMFGGRCFYCGIHVQLRDEPLPRDWLMLKGVQRLMVEDHAHPKARGGEDGIDNRLPACSACNAAKGWLNVEEFRFRSALKLRDLNFGFAGEESPRQRDWLCVYSDDRDLFIHNMPWAAEAFSRGKSLKKRGGQSWKGILGR